MNVWIGTSGYSYPDWVGSFYPAGTRPGRMLAYYACHFPIVELNFTFYRSPTAAMMTKLVEQTPSGFQFLVKLPRSASHDQRRDDLPGFRDAVDELRRRDRFQGVLAQFPQSAHSDPYHRAWVETLADELRDYELAVEFRHHSWAEKGVLRWLEKREIDLVSVDVPNLPGLFPRGLIRTGPRIYIRLHSREAANWYASRSSRYDHDYTKKELGGWVKALEREEGVEQALVLFNNCSEGKAINSANLFRQVMAKKAPELQMVEPFTSVQPVQRSLFE